MKTPATTDALRDFQTRSYFPALDGIRAVSVLMVMSNHLHSNFAFMHRLPGWSGVDVFCVLSGFLITTLLIREENETGTVQLKAFYLRRFFRIVPIFLLVLALYAPLAYFGEHGSRWAAYKSALPLYLTFNQDFVPHEAPFSFSWTLGIEEKFYLVWPYLAFVLCRRLRDRALMASLFFAISSGVYLAMESSYDRVFFQARSYAALAIGALLACFLASKAARIYSIWLNRVPTVLPPALVIVSLGLIVYDRRYLLLFDVAVALLISHLLLESGPLRRWLSSAIPVWIGKRSYAMYLTHLLILNPLRILVRPKNVLAELGVLLVAYVLTAGLAHLLYLFLEQPMRRLGKRIAAPWVLRQEASVAAISAAG